MEDVLHVVEILEQVDDLLHALRIVAGQPIDDATVEETTQRAAIVRSTPEGHEGLSAFLEKRKHEPFTNK